MRQNILTTCLYLVLAALLWHVGITECSADHAGWDGKRRISYQQQKDLFYNHYAQPGPYYNTPSQMYVSPTPSLASSRCVLCG